MPAPIAPLSDLDALRGRSRDGGDALSEPELEIAAQFHHADKLLALKGFLRAHAVDEAALLGVSAARLDALRERFAERARRSAEELLADDAFARAAQALPLRPGDRVVALGDSITEDRQSWAEVLRCVLARTGVHDDVQLLNAGISGETTAGAISRMLPVTRLQPAWVLVFLGTNDARRHGPEPSRMLVGHDETRANLARLRALASAGGTTRLLWIAPPSVIEQQWAQAARVRGHGIAFRAEDVRAKAALVRAQPDPVVDAGAAFGETPATELFLEDGLHPSAEGQRRILELVVERWSAA